MGFLLDSDIDEICARLGEDARRFAGRRILITGARGFLGRYFTEVFLRLNGTVLRDPCEVVALDNFVTSGKLGGELPRDRNFAFVEHDIIKPFYPERPVDYVIHAAGIASPYYYRKFPLETLEVATTGLKNVLELVKKRTDTRLVFFSSSEIYGDPDAQNVPTKESYLGHVSCLGARSAYDESKRLGETLIGIYHQLYGVKACIIRPFNVFGPGMQKTDYRVLPNFMAKHLAGEPVTVYGTGKQTRTFCYATDAIVGFLKVLLHGVAGSPYNIGNPTPEITMLGLVDAMSEAVGADVEMEVRLHPESYPADEPQRRCPDIGRAVMEIGYEPRVKLVEGLRRYYEWAKVAYNEG